MMVGKDEKAITSYYHICVELQTRQRNATYWFNMMMVLSVNAHVELVSLDVVLM